jgi:hypothetical protein
MLLQPETDVAELFPASKPFTVVRSLSRVHSNMNCESTSLDKRFFTGFAFERPLIRMNALVSGEVGSTAKRLRKLAPASNCQGVPLYSPPNCRGMGATLADYSDAPDRSVQVCPFDYGVVLKRVKRRGRVRGQSVFRPDCKCRV